MLTLWGRTTKACDRQTRRDFLRIGTLGLSGLSLADVLRAKASAASQTKPAKSVILYWVDGGPSHIDTYDPKPDAPAEFRGPFETIQSNVPGIQLSGLFEQHARVMDKVSLVRSVHHDNADHFAAAHWMLTGYLGSNAANLDPKYPSAGSIITKLRGPNRPGVPAYVAIPYSMTIGLRPGYNSAAYLGVSYNPFDVGGDPNADNFRVKNLNYANAMNSARLGDRRGLLASLDRLRSAVDRDRLMEGLDRFNQQAFDLVTGDRARQAFEIQREDPRVRERYGRNVYGQSALLARRLVEAGVTFVTVHNGGWDHHWNLESGLKNRVPALDQSIAALIEDLDERSMLDDTLVLVMGEFGRSPRMNDGRGQGKPGRDHWGGVMSVLIGGGGLRGGQVVGKSSPKGEYPIERPMMPADVLATVYHVLGIDLNLSFVNRAGRPTAINNNGQVIDELI